MSATADPHTWFDLAALFRDAGADLRYHAALPGLLVGAGLLFTFLGLAAALSAAGDVVAGGADQARNAALHDLLGAASVKFITSLAGLFLSISYALFRQKQLHEAEQDFGTFLTELQERIPFKTTAILQSEANNLLEKQYTEIQRLETEFFVNLGQTLEHEFGSGLEQHIGPLAGAIDKLVAGLANQNEEATGAMLRAFIERLEGAVGESMRGTAATLEALSARLDGLQGNLDEAAQRMGRAAEEMATALGRGTEAALGGMAEQMGKLMSSMQEAAEEASRNNHAAGDDMVRQMAATASSLSNAVSAFQKKLEESAADGVGRLATPIEALLAQLRDLASKQHDAGAEASDALAATIGRAAASLEATAAKVAEVLGGGAADASSKLIAATEAMRDDLRVVIAQFGSTFNESGAALESGAHRSGKILADAAAALGGDIASVAAQLREAGEAAGVSLRDGGSEARDGMTEAARVLVGGSGGLAERVGNLGATAADLAAQIETLRLAAGSAASPLTASAADLRAAGEAVREATGPLAQTAQSVRAVLDGLVGVTAAMEAAQRQSEGLATRLGVATDRFDGLDGKVAETIRKLGEGVAQLQRQLVVFVRDMDGGLAKSVGSLQATASSLENTLEDWLPALQTAAAGR